jgi:CHAT domain-containing protein
LDAADAELDAIEATYARANYREAAERLLRLRERAGLTPAQRARLLARLAAAQVELGQLDQALRTADEAEGPAREANTEVPLIRIEVARGSAWRFKGFPYRGVAHYENALARAEQAGLEEFRADAMNVLASVHQELGDWSRALDYAQRVLDGTPDPSEAMRFAWLVHRGISHYEFNDGERAGRAFAEALEIAQRTGNVRDESFALGELGLVAWQFDSDYGLAAERFERATALARRIGVSGLEVTWINNLGGVHRDAGRLDEALLRYREALAIEEGTERRRERGTLLKNIGQVLALMGRHAEAEPYLLDAIQEADERNLARIRWMARMELGGVYAALGDARADHYLSASLDTLEAQRSSVLLERFRVGMLGRTLAQYDPYDRYIQFLLTRGDIHKAFGIAEQARARVFLETLTGVRAALAAQVPEAFIRDEAALLERISADQARLRTASPTAAERAALIDSLNAADETLTALRLRLAVDHPATAHARFPRIWTAEEIGARVLQPDERLAMFFLGKDRSYCWLVDRAGVRIVELPPRAEIDRTVSRLLPTLRTPAARVDEEARGWLSRTLATPLLADTEPGTHLVIVPHGSLHYLPFEVLAADDQTFLVEQRTISYAPSVSSLAFLREHRSQIGTAAGVLAIGDPITATALPAGERASALEWLGHLRPLPHSRTELQRINATFRPHVRLLRGPSATEPTLHEALASGQAGIVHFATHAFIDETEPDRSGLVLSADSDGGDGLLQTREVYRLTLPAALVTLSGCETALGREVTGEGLVGIARAFFYAGAKAVTASLWSVSDSATATLMADFYERIRAGAPVDRALAEIKRARIARGGRQAHPYYWAPFVVTGNARVAIEFPPPARLPLPLGAIVLASAALLGALLIVSAVRGRQTPRRRVI